MEVYFVDVGQGTSNVILIGGRRALVIDTGTRASDLLQLLNQFAIAEIACLSLSHLDADHAGAAPVILTQFRGRIGKICYPNDHRVDQTPFWKKLQSELRLGHLVNDQLIRLEYHDRPKSIWRSPAQQADLKLFSPTFGENQGAIAGRDANATSGVLVLRVGDRRLVFPGDSSSAQWREILRRRGEGLQCDAIAVPHHAGMIWPSHWTEAEVRTEMEWLYTNAVIPTYAIVSVGTSNTHEHPRLEVMDTLRNLGIKTICTQITSKCCRSLESLRPGLLPLITPGRSRIIQTLTTSGNSKDLACAGTVVADVSPTAVSIRRLVQHQNAVNALHRNAGTPCCR